jgi:uncharacterized protein YrzB (UPF0473 family)
MKDRRLLVYYDNGEKIICEEKFEFYSEETNKNYIVYADTKEDENGYIRVSANIYEEVDGNNTADGNLATIVNYDQNGNQTSRVIKTYPITTEREWKVIEATIEALQK